MAFNDRKIVKILASQCGKTPERCEGYREEVTNLLADILNYEREHAIGRTNVVQKIGDQINTVGMFLYKNATK